MRALSHATGAVGLLALVACAVAVGGPGRSDPRWVIRDLGTLGRAESVAVAINAQGQVAGNVGRRLIGEAETHPGPSEWGVAESRGFVWQAGTMRDLGTLGGTTVSVAAINDHGQVTGTSATRGVEWPHGFLWQGGRITDLGALSSRQPGGPAGSARSQAVAINERGQIVGFSDSARGQRAFLWQNGHMVSLAGLGGESQARAINDKGTVVGVGYAKRGSGHVRSEHHGLVWDRGRVRDLGGWSVAEGLNDRGEVVGSFGRHAALWVDGRRVDIGTLPSRLGVPPGDPDSVALFVNERGDVIGSSFSSTWYPRGFLWRRGALSALAGEEPLIGGMNETGDIVGSRLDASGKRHATLWGRGAPIDLGTLPGGATSHAIAVNDRGQVVGWATTSSGLEHAVLWAERGS